MRQDEKALMEDLYNEYLVPLKKYAAKIGVSYDDIEDIVHETVIEYYERYRLNLPAKIKTVLLIRILRCRWVDSNRKKLRYQVLRIDDPNDEQEILRKLLASDEMLEILDKELLERELYQELWELIKNMKKIWRDVLLLRIIEDRSTEETCEILGIPGTVCRSRLARGRKELRKRLEKTDIVDY